MARKDFTKSLIIKILRPSNYLQSSKKPLYHDCTIFYTISKILVLYSTDNKSNVTEKIAHQTWKTQAV